MPTKRKPAPTLIVTSLIDGLRISDGVLNEKCMAALEAIGGRVIPVLEKFCAQQTPTPDHQKRLRSLADRIGKFQEIDQRAEDLIIRALTESLRPSNARLNKLAIEALSRLTPQPIDQLIQEAVIRQAKTGFCTRLLKAVSQMDTSPGIYSRFHLLMLGIHESEDIRIEAMRITIKHRYSTPNENQNTNGESDRLPVCTTTQ